MASGASVLGDGAVGWVERATGIDPCQEPAAEVVCLPACRTEGLGRHAGSDASSAVEYDWPIFVDRIGPQRHMLHIEVGVTGNVAGVVLILLAHVDDLSGPLVDEHSCLVGFDRVLRILKI